MFSKVNLRQFVSIDSADVTWVYYFEPVRGVRNKIWLTKHDIKTTIAKNAEKAQEWLFIRYSSCMYVMA